LAVRRADFQARILLTGELEAVHAERITVPRTPTWQLPIRWMETDGAVVEAGQKVLELDNSQFAGDLVQKRLEESRAYNDMARKRADVAVAISDKAFELERRRIHLEKARIEASIPAAIRSAREDQDAQLALSRAETERRKGAEDLESAKKSADAEVAELRVALDRAATEIREAEQAIEALSLHAPRAGIIVVAENRGEGRKFQVGDNVWVGLAVMRMPDLSRMKVVARLSDVDDGRIAVGMRAECAIDTYPDLTFSGTIIEISPVAQEDRRQSLRRSFRVEIALDGSDPDRMRPGMSVRAEIVPPLREQALVAPRVSLDLSGDVPRALLRDGSSVEVALGPCNALDCVIDEGLTEGVRLRRRS
jgi:multidrug resistance efflux pump